MDALRQFSHRTRTENNAPAYDSTLSATLDAFHKLTYFSWGPSVGELLDKAWAENPHLTLKIVWNLRSIHDGKAEKEAFYRAFGWLYDNHPRTAIANLHLLVDPVCVKSDDDPGRAHGYWKDLLNILALATVDQLSNISKPPRFLHNLPDRKGRFKDRKKPEPTNLDKLGIEIDLKPVVKAQRVAVGIANHARIALKLVDPKYRALYVAVARLFAQRLLTDWRFLLDSQAAPSTEARNALLRNISLAPKWAPSLLGAHDRHTNIATAISRLIYQAKDDFPTFRFPSALENHPAPDSAEATDILRSFYRRWLLSPLRDAAIVTERLMSANRWTEIPYTRVSSACMKNNKEHFFTHDPDRFQKYLISVEKGQRTISGATLLPHELVAELFHAQGPVRDAKFPELAKHRQELAEANARVVEAQWKTLVQNLRDAGTLENSIAVCDVSGSMGSLHTYDPKLISPIFPAISLSLLLAQLAKPPFNGGFVTFSQNPEFVRLDPAASLRTNIETMNRVQWEMNTDFKAVFLRLLLPLAIENKVKPEDMIKRVFVFSDMQFDEANEQPFSSTRKDPAVPWNTNHVIIERAFKAAGYEVPQIVYWNLSQHGTVEVMAEQKGAAMMSGFSPSMLKVFMGDDVAELEESEPVPESDDPGGDPVPVERKVPAEFNPLNVMKKALSRPSFDGLVVVD
ncbi:hypothetical protein B0H14DRAFT_2371069 [Mycena olivaceomarginata]|nr:hypothetical protein B0H14DRAFT_2371069 [Mycena olivaceomarginata]